jgi:L-threonylcarbamoyladenylate synthase
MTERIDLSRADDPRDVVHRAVACLAQGGTVGLPTETTYGVVAGALHPSAIARLGSMLGPEDSRPRGIEGLATLFLKGPGEVDDWGEVSTELGRRLTRRAWPGAVTLIFPTARRGLSARLPAEVARFLVPDGVIALRAPSNPMVRELLRLLPCPLIQVDPPSTDGRWPTTADALADHHDLDMILDIGPTQFGGPSTVVEVESNRWSIARTGVVPDTALARMAGTILLFICTGNTCRSPMAEALCKGGGALRRSLGDRRDAGRRARHRGRQGQGRLATGTRQPQGRARPRPPR